MNTWTLSQSDISSINRVSPTAVGENDLGFFPSSNANELTVLQSLKAILRPDSMISIGNLFDAGRTVWGDSSANSAAQTHQASNTESTFSPIQNIVSAIQLLGETKTSLRNVEKCTHPTRAYDKFEELLSGNWSETAVLSYLAFPSNQYRNLLLGCLADLQIELPRDLLHCLVGLLHETDEKVANCASLALLAGGDEAVELLHSSIAKFGLLRIREFIDACSVLG